MIFEAKPPYKKAAFFVLWSYTVGMSALSFAYSWRGNVSMSVVMTPVSWFGATSIIIGTFVAVRVITNAIAKTSVELTDDKLIYRWSGKSLHLRFEDVTWLSESSSENVIRGIEVRTANQAVLIIKEWYQKDYEEIKNELVTRMNRPIGQHSYKIGESL